MTYPDLSPKAWAVLRDLEDTERHRRCEGYVWKYDAGTFECDSCGVRRRADPMGDYTDTRRYELPIVESRRPRSDCSYQLDRGFSHPRGMSS
jgi:hypothetical protein